MSLIIILRRDLIVAGCLFCKLSVLQRYTYDTSWSRLLASAVPGTW